MKGRNQLLNSSCILVPSSFWSRVWGARCGRQPPTSSAEGRVFTEQWHLLTQETNEAVPEKRNIQLQTLIIRNKGNKGSWFFGNSLKYHFDVNAIVSVRGLFSNDSEGTSVIMGLNPRCHCTSKCWGCIFTDTAGLYSALKTLITWRSSLL